MSVERETARNDFELRFLERHLGSVYVYWSALLIVNGLLFTFFSLEALGGSLAAPPFIYLLLGAQGASVWLLIWNFHTVKEAFYRLEAFTGDGLPDHLDDPGGTVVTPSDVRRLAAGAAVEYRANLRRDAGGRLRRLRARETVVEGLLVLQILLVLLVVVET